jgi:hypothetical protein
MVKITKLRPIEIFKLIRRIETKNKRNNKNKQKQAK